MKKLFMMMLFSTQLYAGGVIGNGGDAVKCTVNHAPPLLPEVTYRMLDFYEAEAFNREPITLNDGNTAMEKVEIALKKFMRLEPILGKVLLDRSKEFFNEVQPDNGRIINLTDIPDSYYFYLEANCEVQQVAIRRAESFPGEPNFILDWDIYKQFDEVNKAGLILHELVYEQYFLMGYQNSIRARYLTSLIASDFFENAGVEDYRQREEAIGDLAFRFKFGNSNLQPMVGDVYKISVKSDSFFEYRNLYMVDGDWDNPEWITCPYNRREMEIRIRDRNKEIINFEITKDQYVLAESASEKCIYSYENSRGMGGNFTQEQNIILKATEFHRIRRKNLFLDPQGFCTDSETNNYFAENTKCVALKDYQIR